MMNNPMMLQSDPNSKIFRFGSKRGLMKHEPGSKDWEALVTLGGGSILLQVNGYSLDSEKAVMDYLQALDQKKVLAAFAVQ